MDSKKKIDVVFEEALERNRELWRKAHHPDADYEFPLPHCTLKSCFSYWTEKHPDNDFIVYKDVVYSYAECDEKARRIANYMLSLGCKKGDRVLLYLANSIDLILLNLACFKIGAYVINSNPFDTAFEMHDRYLDCTPFFVACDEWSLTKVIEAIGAPEDGSAQYIIDCISDAPENPVNKTEALSAWPASKIIPYEKMLTYDNTEEPDVDIKPDDVALLLYTGGTTGKSKGCCLTNEGLIGMALTDREVLIDVLEGEWRILVGVPMSHAAGYLSGVIDTIGMGGCTIILSQAKPALCDFFESIEKYRATIMPVIPVQLTVYVNTPELHKFDLSSVKMFVVGGAPVPVDVMEAFNQLNDIPAWEMYGLSEASKSVTMMPRDKIKVGTSGIPQPHIEILVVDVSDGTTVMPIGEAGEIIVKSPFTMKGYWNDPESTAKQIKNGWLYTGDVGLIDEDGYLQVKGRTKNMIIVSGFNVYPREIDDKLLEHPDIVDACTVGVTDPTRGQMVKSYIVRRPGSSLTKEDIDAYCSERLTRYKRPKIIEFLDEIPKTKNHKHDYRALSERE